MTDIASSNSEISARSNRNGRPDNAAWSEIREALTPLEQAKLLGRRVEIGLSTLAVNSLHFVAHPPY